MLQVMLETLLLAATIGWPTGCTHIGDLYERAATLRDRGVSVERVFKMTEDRRIRRTIGHVYERSDMTPEQWRWFMIGACVGTSEETNDSRGGSRRNPSR